MDLSIILTIRSNILDYTYREPLRNDSQIGKIIPSVAPQSTQIPPTWTELLTNSKPCSSVASGVMELTAVVVIFALGIVAIQVRLELLPASVLPTANPTSAKFLPICHSAILCIHQYWWRYLYPICMSFLCVLHFLTEPEKWLVNGCVRFLPVLA